MPTVSAVKWTKASSGVLLWGLVMWVFLNFNFLPVLSLATGGGGRKRMRSLSNIFCKCCCLILSYHPLPQLREQCGFGTSFLTQWQAQLLTAPIFPENVPCKVWPTKNLLSSNKPSEQLVWSISNRLEGKIWHFVVIRLIIILDYFEHYIINILAAR